MSATGPVALFGTVLLGARIVLAGGVLLVPRRYLDRATLVETFCHAGPDPVGKPGQGSW